MIAYLEFQATFAPTHDGFWNRKIMGTREPNI